MRIAIMQPYFFPFIGYFQLIDSVDKFIFYDDVNFIKRGWINRNKILINNSPKYITVPLVKASQNKKINEIDYLNDKGKLLRTIEMSYKKAPFFSEVFPIISNCFNIESQKISDLAIKSIDNVKDYLQIDNVVFEKSSIKYSKSIDLVKEQRLKDICKLNNSNKYINAIGGRELYSKEDFKESGIDLGFLEPSIPTYKQFNDKFVPGLSIIDVLMFNSKEKVIEMIKNYDLI